MEEGDIIFAPQCVTSWFGHIGIIARDNDGVLKVCEAVPDAGVTFREIQKFVDDPTYKEVYIFSVGVDKSKKQEAASYAYSKKNQPYSISIIYPYNQDTGNWNCGKLVYMAYLSTGVKFNVDVFVSIWPLSLVDPVVNPFVPTSPKNVLSKFGYNAGEWRVEKNPRLLADIRGRGYPDIVGFGNDGVHIAFNNGDGTFENPKMVLNKFGYDVGGWRVDRHPRFLADIKGRGCLDIVGFGNDGVQIAFNNGNGTFKNPEFVLNEFGYYSDAGGWRVDRQPRFLADIRGRGYPDIVGFGNDGVYIAFNKGDGTFENPEIVLNEFGYDVGGWRIEMHPRFLADMTGDGSLDIVGFGNDGVYIAFNNGNGTFKNPEIVSKNFGYNAGGWRVESHPRFLADMKGDGCLDIVGFGNDGVYVAFNEGKGSFSDPKMVLNSFGFNAGGWRVESHLRFLADLRGRSCPDIVGFGNDGVYIAFNNGDGSFNNRDGTFQTPRKVLNEFGYNAGGWRVEKHPRFLADLRGSCCLDIVGFGNDGVFVQYSSPCWEKQNKTT
jgi:hypothetical protein